MLDNIKSVILLIVLTMLIGVLFAAGETIYDIRVEGTQNVDAALVKDAISLRLGDPLDPEEVSKSIKNLYKLTIFSDVQISSEPYRTGINLIIRVSEYPIVDKVDFEDFKAIKKERIDELLGLRIGSYWSPFQKNQTLRKLKAEYESKGFKNATITIEENLQENNRIRVKVTANEGRRVAIQQITFIGNYNYDDRTLSRRMKTKSSSLLRSGRFEQEKFDEDLKILAAFYHKNGFIDMRIANWELKQLTDRHLELIITIDEGTKFTFGSISLKGSEHFNENALLSQFTLKSGEPFDQEKFDAQLRKVYSMYFDEGFIYSSVDPKKIRDGELLNIELTITEGSRARVRQVHIGGNRKTKEKVLRRQLEIAPGEYFRQTQVLRSQQNIYNLGFFEPDIRLDYKQINMDGDIDLSLDVIDKSSGTANGGVGYNSQDKFIGQLSLSQNNLFGNNWSTGIKWEFGGDTQNFELSFTNPNFYDSNTLVGSSLYYTTKNWSAFYYEIFTRGASIRAGQPIPWVNNTRFVAGYSLYSKKYRITNMSQIMADSLSNQTLIDLNRLSWRYTSSVSFTISRDTRDNIFFPTSGSQIMLYNEVAGGPIGGDFDFYKHIAQVNWYMETWYKLALRTKWRFGYVTPYGRSDDAPPDEKFYLGGTGADGVRGYPDRSIGPSGGGTRSALFSTELGIPIGSDQIIGVLFFDAGNSYNKLRDFNFLDFKKGTGVGLRIRSPFGLIGFDYAYSINDRGWEPHLQFGTTF